MELLVPALLFVCLLVALPISMLLAVRLVTRRMARQAEQAQAELMQAMQTAVPAEAEIVSMRTLAGREADGVLVMRLTLRVSPPQGEPYTAFTTWEIDLPSVGQLAPGQLVPARVSPSDPKVVYPNVTWARPSAWK